MSVRAITCFYPVRHFLPFHRIFLLLLYFAMGAFPLFAQQPLDTPTASGEPGESATSEDPSPAAKAEQAQLIQLLAELEAEQVCHQVLSTQLTREKNQLQDQIHRLTEDLTLLEEELIGFEAKESEEEQRILQLKAEASAWDEGLTTLHKEAQPLLDLFTDPEGMFSAHPVQQQYWVNLATQLGSSNSSKRSEGLLELFSEAGKVLQGGRAISLENRAEPIDLQLSPHSFLIHVGFAITYLVTEDGTFMSMHQGQKRAPGKSYKIDPATSSRTAESNEKALQVEDPAHPITRWQSIPADFQGNLLRALAILRRTKSPERILLPMQIFPIPPNIAPAPAGEEK